MRRTSSKSETTSIDWLMLVPTAFEYERLLAILPARSDTDVTIRFEIVGFGPVVAAARAVQLILQCRPRRVVLTGIAGTYSHQLPVGQATVFSSVGCYGIGAGSGRRFQTAGQMGWPHWSGDADASTINDRIDLTTESRDSGRAENDRSETMLLTVMSAAENEQDVADRLAIFPDAAAEDMEAFGVAAACQLCDVPLTIVRGMSNRAGDRDKKNWLVDRALESAAVIVSELIAAHP